ncbi:uncharacterized protein AC631_02041 [Debaryomyces fabryi]|uniref:ubiquitinyl hydrolase 1 n=1 Tax=Debaryomyces fabryi TaxID=58627 RepID=A0A0V1Q1Z4_9ASCO|nr:uncharacterized protein AC631_02041 [Debaryomyces fabryi]KSA02223.1 hypothetical protein AC631_02041 [Debaryomyces fabryi]CUM46589.1 unnamed protein product [Debaryomyces fabryi]
MSEEANKSPSMPGDYSFGTKEEVETQQKFEESDTDGLQQRREILSQLLHIKDIHEGDTLFLVSRDYVDDILNLPADTFEELKNKVGPINCKALVDEAGFLYPEDEKLNTVATRSIKPDVFQKLMEWFGIHGEPIARAAMLNPTTDTIEVEKFPPYFHIHTLLKGNTNRTYNGQVHNGVYLSRTRTFNDLFDAIRVTMFKNSANQKQIPFRIWFIPADNSDNLPSSISLFAFINDVRKKHLLRQDFYNYSLKSQGIVLPSYHILVESFDKSIKSYPVDNYFNSVDLSSFEIEKMIETGGNLGLANLGNTCYMNSALQCLLHVPEINYYFFYNIFEKELNKSNPLGNKGQIAIAFGSLLHKLFDNLKNTNSSFVSPREFKFTIGHYSSMFHGYQQQDSQEFLSWLLDALHEDLNRIYNKPYCEKPELKDDEVNDPNAIARLADTCWHQHKQRNDSVIVDLFTGLYQSTLICPACSKTSITFDPFNDLTLPLPINKKWYHTFTIIDLSTDLLNLESRIMKLEVELDKTSNFDELLKYLSTFLKIPQKYIFLFEIFNNFFYKDFQAKYNKLKFFPTSEIISDSDDILVYIIPHNPETDIIIPVINTVTDQDKSYNISNPFGLPLFVVLDKVNDVRSFGKIRQKLESTVKVLSKIDIDAHYNEIKKSNKQYHSTKDFPLLARSLQEDTDMLEDDSTRNITSDEEYDSDISLANPNVGGDYGFNIRHYRETKPLTRSFNKFNYNSDDQDVPSDGVLNIPNLRPNFNNLPKLSDELPQLKQNYYYYPRYVENSANENEQDVISDDKEKVHEDYVVVENNSDDEIESNPAKDTPQELLDEGLDTENENNGPENIGLLFDSVSDLPSQKNDPKLNSELKTDNHPVLVFNNTTLVCEWDFDIFSKLFENPADQKWINLSYIPNAQLEANKRKLEQQQKSTVSLYDCLKSFSTPEILGDQDLWYCPNCKDHKQATKTIQIWSTGDLLTIHLKRFQSARSFSDKINMVVDFPIEGLDMSSFVSKEEDDSGLIYDLIAVDNHYGGLGGGHYTASVKNFRDNKWYYFNDGRVSEMSDPTECITGAAYLLFYRKRKPTSEFLGGDELQSVIQEGRNNFSQNLKDLMNNLTKTKEQVDDFNQHDIAFNSHEELKLEQADEQQQEVENSSKISDISQPNEQFLSAKKSRLPMNEEATSGEFHGGDNFNRRKQRLISKNKNYNKSISIKPDNAMDYSSSNIASPLSSGSEDNIVSDNISLPNSDANVDDK